MEYKLTINGLYEYRPTIFDSFHLPQVWTAARLGIPETQYIDQDTVNSIDFSLPAVKKILFDRIRLDTLPFSCVYASGEVLEAAIGIWSSSMVPKWQQLYNTLFYRFNPLWNKDATITESKTGSTGTNVNRTSSAMDRTTYSSASKDRNTDLVRSYEEGDVPVKFDPTLQHNNDIDYITQKKLEESPTIVTNLHTGDVTSLQDTVKNAPKENGTVPTNYLTNINPSVADKYEEDPTVEVYYTPSGSQDMTHQLESINSFDHAFTDAQANTENTTESTSRREYGNIGVMSTQELIERSRKLALFSIFDIIIADFIKYFCILVY